MNIRLPLNTLLLFTPCLFFAAFTLAPLPVATVFLVIGPSMESAVQLVPEFPDPLSTPGSMPGSTRSLSSPELLAQTSSPEFLASSSDAHFSFQLSDGSGQDLASSSSNSASHRSSVSGGDRSEGPPPDYGIALSSCDTEGDVLRDEDDINPLVSSLSNMQLQSRPSTPYLPVSLKSALLKMQL